MRQSSTECHRAPPGRGPGMWVLRRPGLPRQRSRARLSETGECAGPDGCESEPRTHLGRGIAAALPVEADRAGRARRSACTAPHPQPPASSRRTEPTRRARSLASTGARAAAARHESGHVPSRMSARQEASPSPVPREGQRPGEDVGSKNTAAPGGTRQRCPENLRQGAQGRGHTKESVPLGAEHALRRGGRSRIVPVPTRRPRFPTPGSAAEGCQWAWAPRLYS